MDIHQIDEGRKLILGGVEIEHTKGCLGHSDADVLLHAIAEAILGALALGDLGKHFPDTAKHTEGMDLMPASEDLASTEMTLHNVMSRETVLKQYIEQVKAEYDYILIDCGPSLELLTINALTAADSIIIPVLSHYLPTKGLEKLLKTIARTRRSLNPNLALDGILLTMVDNRTNFAKEICQAIRKAYGNYVFHTEIPHSIRLAEMATTGESIFQYEPKGKTAEAYESLAREVLSLEKEIRRNKAEHDR